MGGVGWVGGERGGAASCLRARARPTHAAGPEAVRAHGTHGSSPAHPPEASFRVSRSIAACSCSKPSALRGKMPVGRWERFVGGGAVRGAVTIDASPRNEQPLNPAAAQPQAHPQTPSTWLGGSRGGRARGGARGATCRRRALRGGEGAQMVLSGAGARCAHPPATTPLKSAVSAYLSACPSCPPTCTQPAQAPRLQGIRQSAPRGASWSAGGSHARSCWLAGHCARTHTRAPGP